MSHRQRIFDMLMREVRDPDVGVATVRSACDQFLKLGLKAGAEIAEGPRSFPKQMIEKAWLKQGGRCNICKDPLAKDEAAGDHVIPYSEGGKIEQRNCAAVHGPCNSSKGSGNLLKESKRSGLMFNQILPRED